MPGGRPSDYSLELAAEICARISDGQSLREICRDGAMPATSTVFLWIGKYPEFSDQYAKAKAAMAEHLAEDLLDITDDANNDWMERFDPQGKSTGWVLNGEHVQRSRLRIDTRKWLLSKMLPKKYGEKIVHAGDADAPVAVLHRIERLIVDPNTSNSNS